MKKYLIGFILAGLSTTALADFDLRRINPDPTIQATKEHCYATTPKDKRGVVYRTAFRQCMIDSGVLKGNYHAKSNRNQQKRMSFQEMHLLEQRAIQRSNNQIGASNNNPNANQPFNPNNLNYPQVTY